MPPSVFPAEALPVGLLQHVVGVHPQAVLLGGLGKGKIPGLGEIPHPGEVVHLGLTQDQEDLDLDLDQEDQEVIRIQQEQMRQQVNTS